jgi:hypothetical protein
MRAYGYPCDTDAYGQSPIQLREIAIEADEAFLEALIAFAQAALAEVRTLGKRFDHVHFRDTCDAGRNAWPDIVFTNTYSSVALDEG